MKTIDAVSENELSNSNSEKENKDFMLTTKDNPFSPWTHWDEWYAFDHEKGYFSCEYLARIAITSSDMTEEENDEEIKRAIEEIIRIDPFDIYTKAYEPDSSEKDSSK